MKKPSKNLIKLIEIGLITGIDILYRQTGSESSDTFCEIRGLNGECKGQWSSYKPYISVSVDWRSIAHVKHSSLLAYNEWVAYEKENETELKEYERLKAKFAQVTGER